MTEVKSLAVMRDEVEQYCRDKGWYDEEVPFGQAMALLHEEAAEAGHAWREHGLADATEVPFEANPGGVACDIIVKPEGVGSEFADILIRMLDDDARYHLEFAEFVEDDEEIFALDDNFLVNVNTLHGLIARVSMAMETCYESHIQALAGVFMFLRQFSKQCGIDLMAEYERKMRYNRTRAYRHGGRRA